MKVRERTIIVNFYGVQEKWLVFGRRNISKIFQKQSGSTPQRQHLGAESHFKQSPAHIHTGVSLEFRHLVSTWNLGWLWTSVCIHSVLLACYFRVMIIGVTWTVEKICTLENVRPESFSIHTLIGSPLLTNSCRGGLPSKIALKKGNLDSKIVYRGWCRDFGIWIENMKRYEFRKLSKNQKNISANNDQGDMNCGEK